MASTNYAASLSRVLAYEGGKVDDPKDPGGRTNQGVIQRVYDGYRRRRGQPTRDVYAMDTSERDAIYRVQYWDAIHGDELPAGVDLAVFDAAVNSGPSQAVKWLQRALGMATADGNLGQATLAAVAAHGDAIGLVSAICDRRLAFLKALKTWTRFGKGWSTRVENVRRNGALMAKGQPGGLPMFTGVTPKASISDAKARPVMAAADAATGGGVMSGGALAAVQQAKDTLAPLTGTSAIDNIMAGLAVLSVVLVAGGLAWRWYANRKAAHLATALDLPAGTP